MTDKVKRSNDSNLNTKDNNSHIPSTFSLPCKHICCHLITCQTSQRQSGDHTDTRH